MIAPRVGEANSSDYHEAEVNRLNNDSPPLSVISILQLRPFYGISCSWTAQPEEITKLNTPINMSERFFNIIVANYEFGHALDSIWIT